MENSFEDALCLEGAAESIRKDESALATLAPRSVEEMGAALGIPGWRQAALSRYMDWLPDRMVTEDEYKQALAALDNRRLGGGKH